MTTSVDYSGKAIKWMKKEDGEEIVREIEKCGEELEEINLSGNVLGLEVAEMIAESLKNKSALKRLYLYDLFTGMNIKIITSSLNAIFDAVIQAGCKITELDVSDNAFGYKGVETLVKLFQSPCCNQLRVLRINNNGYGIVGAKSLMGMIKKWHESLVERGEKCCIQVFECGRNRLEDEGIESLSLVLSIMTSLRILKAPQNGIRRTGCTSLVSVLSSNRNLQVLNLNDNLLLQDGAIEIAKALSELSDISELDLGDCLIRDNGTLAIINSLGKCSSLVKLDVSFNEITTPIAIMLIELMAKNENFQWLNLDGNRFGINGKTTVGRLLETLTHFTATFTDDEGDEETSEEENEEKSDEILEQLKKLHI